ncbi:metal cation symporter ZIP14 isoform X2 [Nematostella vectensis]|uniref:metal cation symporter ZIP14 isoform X2 n=1 Tax=Nematostella vectensis TaxID=45351 RepID=UPI0020773D78|nr:metal cation symporter ZIP14 isoform X2 [Nematostella vectensis]
MSTWIKFCFLVVFCALCTEGTPANSKPDFWKSLLEKLGTNTTMNYEQFQELLRRLKIGTDERTSTPNGITNKCWATKDLMNYAAANKTEVDKSAFRDICPALVQQAASGACHDAPTTTKHTARPTKLKAWGYSILSVFIISVGSMVGAVAVPCIRHSMFQMALMMMSSLAVGVLGGVGIFHLIPGALGHGGDGDYLYLYKCAVVAAGIYLFIIMEYLMQIYLRFSGGHGHTHQLTEVHTPLEAVKPPEEMYRPITEGNIGQVPLDPLEEENPEKKKQVIKPVAWMVLLGDSMHNFLDGLAIGAAFSNSIIEGFSTSLAIFCEEVPHELGDFAVLLSGGMTVRQALGFNFLSACVCFVGMAIGLLLGYTTHAVKWIYALAGGMFVYIALVAMLPEVNQMSMRAGQGSVRKNLKVFAMQNVGMICGFIIMFVLAMYQSQITL